MTRLFKRILNWWRSLFAKKNAAPALESRPVYDAKTTVKRSLTENPHLTSWKAYTKHLMQLEAEGHGDSPPAQQVRKRLQYHWMFLSTAERAAAHGAYLDSMVHREILKANLEAHRANLKTTQKSLDDMKKFMGIAHNA